MAIAIEAVCWGLRSYVLELHTPNPSHTIVGQIQLIGHIHYHCRLGWPIDHIQCPLNYARSSYYPGVSMSITAM